MPEFFQRQAKDDGVDTQLPPDKPLTDILDQVLPKGVYC